jgi:hypothetical protein
MRGWVAPGRSLRYKRLENRMPNHAVLGDFRVGDFSIKARLNPCRVRLLEAKTTDRTAETIRKLSEAA